MPTSTSQLQDTRRHLGLLTGVATLLFLGVADGLTIVARVPSGALGPFDSAQVLFYAISIHCLAGLVWGIVVSLLLRVGRFNPTLRATGSRFLEGPRGWFRPEPEASRALICAAIWSGLTLGPLFPASYWIITHFHAPALMALGILLCAIATQVFAVGILALISPAILAVLRRFDNRAASPGAILVVLVGALVAQSTRFYLLNRPWLRNLSPDPIIVVSTLALGTPLLLGLLVGWRRRRATPIGLTPMLAVAMAVILLTLVSALTFGGRQSVVAATFAYSRSTGHIVRELRRVLDWDRDGYSFAFGGRDCNDHDPRVHPGASDIPGNGVDENCTGHDAVARSDLGDGFYSPVPPTLGDRAPSFLLLSVDAMRPDHMGAYGYRRPTTPHMDAFSRLSARFTEARCVSPRSLRSFASIWTGLYPSQVEWGNEIQFPPLSESNHTLAEHLRDAGYHTAAFLDTGYFVHTLGFFQGFTDVHQTLDFRSEPTPTVNALREYLRSRDGVAEPFLAWSHLMVAHDPYEDRTTPQDFGAAPMDQYDEALAFADELLGPVLAQAVEMNTRRPVYVFLFADHGEAFGEHGVFHHSFDLHDEALRVPLIVYGPGIAPGTRSSLAALFDLYPTILNLANRPSSVPIVARSLVAPLLQREDRPPTGWRSELYGEVTPDGVFPSEQKSLFAAPYKIIHDLRRGTWELFDISRDPLERHNLFDDQSRVADTMRERLLTWADLGALAANRSSALIDQARLRVVPPMEHRLDIQFEDALELLGYDLPATRLEANQFFRAVFYYRVLRRTETPVWIDVYFEPQPGEPPFWPFFRARHFPVYGRYPTTEWNPGEIIRDEVRLLVDEAVHPTRLRTFFALETENRERRIRPRTGGTPGGAVELAPIEVISRRQ